MKKRILCLALVVCMALSVCACGSSSGYGVKTVQVLVSQEYSLAFRNDDPIYYYVTAAIETLAAEGKVDELATKWFGDRIINFDKRADALSELTPPAVQTFTIGLDANAFPMSYASNDSYWGFDVELAIAVCERLGWTLKMQPIEKENVYIELSSGNIDCAWGGIALDDSEVEAGKFTQYGPYVHNDIVIATREGSSVWNKLRLSGRNMAMCSTTEAMAALDTQPKLKKRLGQITRLAGGTTECFEYLYAGKCDLVLTDSTALYYYNCH
jgi:ABC-type amino acid transport substrate-binding protein